MTITTPNRRPIRRAVWIVPSVVFACAVLAVPCSRADDDVVVEEQALDEGNPQRRLIEPREAANQVANLVQNYEHQVFMHTLATRRTPVPPGTKPGTVRERVDACAAEWLRRIDVSCGLTAGQRDRLQAALHDDIESAVAQIEADIARYKAMRFEGRDMQFQRDMYMTMAEDAARAREQLTQAFDSDSVFFKVLPTTLAAEQFARLEADFNARRAARWAVAVASLMDTLDNLLGLTTRQYDALEQALLARQPALRVYPPQAENRHVAQVLACIELAGMDEDELRAIVNERQWQVLESFRRSGELSRPHYVKQGWYEP